MNEAERRGWNDLTRGSCRGRKKNTQRKGDASGGMSEGKGNGTLED